MMTQEGHTSSQHGLEIRWPLEERLRQFDSWAVSADRRNCDWQTDFPQWSDLIHVAVEAMAGEPLNASLFPLLDRCWSLSSEAEECSDWARRHLNNTAVRQLVELLTGSTDPNTRWQAYDVLGDLPTLDASARALLEAGLKDDNSYVRRRSFLALLRHTEMVQSPYLLSMLKDADAYNRYVAVKEARKHEDPALRVPILDASRDVEVGALLVRHADHQAKTGSL